MLRGPISTMNQPLASQSLSFFICKNEKSNISQYFRIKGTVGNSSLGLPTYISWQWRSKPLRRTLFLACKSAEQIAAGLLVRDCFMFVIACCLVTHHFRQGCRLELPSGFRYDENPSCSDFQTCFLELGRPWNAWAPVRLASKTQNPVRLC